MGASWAAAGMLAITAELEDAADAERALALRAHALWPAFAAELEEASGRAVYLSASGALLLAADAAELEAMRPRAVDGLRIVGADEARTPCPAAGVRRRRAVVAARGPCRQPRPGRGAGHRLPESGRHHLAQ